MTRPRVPDNKRQRTARACDSCKRRKQKCNGLKPCNTCQKRRLTCNYTDRRGSSKRLSISSPSTTKRRHTTKPPDTTGAILGHESVPDKSPGNARKQADRSVRSITKKPENQEKCIYPIHDTSSTSGGEGPSRQSTSSETDEEAEVIGQVRMLQDPIQRLLYIGDSSTLSYLQLIRMIVGNATGSSPFTDDPNRHNILEPVTSAPPTSMIPYILPEREVSNLLVCSYFTNTHGLIELFDRKTLHGYLDVCYSNPLSVSSSTLCLVYLTLAIGLVMATPAPSSPEEASIKRLRDDPADRAEALFRAAKCLSDPLNGIENADLWVVQAWTLMTVYMLAISKRNAAYAYCGIAVRSAFSLGLHRIRETMVKFDNEGVRRNIWRSLFVLDRFLAASLGRPAAICEDDCSDDSLETPVLAVTDPEQAAEEMVRSRSLDSSVKTSRSIGQVLNKIYLRRKISTRLAQEIVDQCELWSINVDPSFASENLFDGKVSADKGMAILHIHLLHHHSILLLTRPFFLYLLLKTRPAKSNDREPFRRTCSRLEKLSQACVAASTRSVALIQAAFDAKYLPRRNPFVLYFLFAAILIILSNEFAGLYKNEHYSTSISSTMNIMEYCATADIQAQRMLYIIKAFRSDVDKHSQSPDIGQRRDPSLREGSIADPVRILDSRRQSVVARQSLRPSGLAVGGDESSATQSRLMNAQPVAPMQIFGHATGGSPVVGRREYTMTPANSRRTSTHSRTGRPSRYRTDAESAKTESAGTEHEFDFDSLWDFRPGADSDNGDEYVHEPESRPASHGTQPALQLHAGGYGTYSAGHGMSNGNQTYVASAGVNFGVPFYPAMSNGTSAGQG